MARSTLFQFSRANRRGEIITSEFVVPVDLAPGVIRGTLNIHPNQRTDESRWMRAWIEQRIGDEWVHIGGLGWQGNLNTEMPWFQFDIDLYRGETMRGVMQTRADINTNIGGIFEWIDFAESDPF